ncbi:MAG: hypothetical protein LBE06_11950 [Azoarcus sp.]|jgi:hydroxymethylpyrimidine pyrophosphatase-like HAD family hydrolase|nr:hypothetical protein [Azoarcus sp.]
MLKKFLFVDLDDTLFQSRRKCPERGDLTPAAYLRDGSAHSFLTPAQHSLLALLQREMTLIPVTARNADAFSRVRLGFRDGGIIDFGGVIIDAHGVPDAPWLERSAACAADSLAMLKAALAAMQTHAAALGVTLRARLIEDFGVPFYLSAKSAEGDEKVLDALEPAVRAHSRARPLNIHRNGNNLAVLPDWLDKRHAVEHLIARLRARHGEILTFGMGDSLSDLGFMRTCDYALVPRASQIAATMEDRT